ncbi:MAG TPA: winged helix-turn-helix transcriptional regulator, partial [Thermoplasmata archaeon]|nr:winged helix-turn-helix transcriptional regulator [Thermoplasmata archaeon]
ILASFYLVDALRFALFSVSASMMMRVGREKVLDQFVRGQVFGAIVLQPGINYTEIRRRLRIANGQLAYHLHILLKEEFVLSRRVGAHACFFPAGVPVDIGAGIRLSPLQERLVAMLRSSPGASQTVLAARLDRPVKTIHYNVSRLQKQGMLRVERAGKGSACYAIDPPPAPAKQVDISAI